MVKNNYPLPLISDVIKNIETKKIFMKIDLRWEYNNMRIKEEDEQKVAFIILEGYLNQVMFFGLTNLLAIFQVIMNELLKDLINIGKVKSFIDDIIVEIETEEEYNELITEILRRLEENYFYVKPEKCKQKVREINFLEDSDWTRRNKNKKKKSESSIELAGFQIS